MRIAFIGNPSTVHIQRWVAEFKARGHHCRLYAPAAPQLRDYDAEPIGVAGTTGVPAIALRVLDLREQLRRFQPDVLHAHYALDYGTWGALSGFRPLVITCMGSDLLVAPNQSLKSRAKVALALRWATLVTVNAGHLGSAAVRLGARPERVQRIVQGVFPDIYLPAKPSRRTGAPVILSTRQLHPIYRIDDLIRACGRLAEVGHTFRLNIAGRGPEETRLKQLTEVLGLQAQVSFLGQIDGEPALAAAYRGADIYASVSESDGASVALLEAMACGLPAVASDIAASREWLTEGSGNVLVHVGDVDAIANALAWFITEPARRHRAGNRNRRIALARASWPVEMDKMEALYESLVQGRANPPDPVGA